MYSFTGCVLSVLTWALAVREQALDCLLGRFPPGVAGQTPRELSRDAGIQALARARNLRYLLLRISAFWGVRPCGPSRGWVCPALRSVLPEV